jgi:hypothetical protein
MANEFPVLDGIAPSWADISVKASPYGGALIETPDLAAINTGRSIEVGVQRGASGGRVMQTTTGQGDQECSLTLYQNGFQKFLRALMALAPSRNGQVVLSIVHFDIQIQFQPPGSVEIYERHVRGCRVISDALNPAEGSEANKVEVGLHCKQIVDIIDGREVVLL